MSPTHTNFLHMSQRCHSQPPTRTLISDHRLRDSNLAAALRWAFAKCPSIDSLTVAEMFQIPSDVLNLPIYQQLRRIRLAAEIRVDDDDKPDQFIRALSGPDQSDLTELKFGGTSFYVIKDRYLLRPLLRRHAASLRHLNTHHTCRRFRR